MNTHTRTHRHRRILSRGSDGYERLRSSCASGGKNITDGANWEFSYNVTLEHVERERNYCSVAHELKVPFIAVDANCSKCSRARESRLVFASVKNASMSNMGGGSTP